MHNHGTTAQITDFISWVVPKHVASKSFVYSILCIFFFLLVDLSPHSALRFFFFHKVSLFIKRRISFQILGYIFVTELYVAL